MKKRNRLTICLVAGVLILAVSATAAFGSVNGYSKYKEALKALAMESENFTASGTVTLNLDGKEMLTEKVTYAMDGANHASHQQTIQNGKVVHEQYDTNLNGVDTWFNTDQNVYYTAETSNEATNLMGFNKDDEMESRLVTFMEMAADTVVGELKNNFVQVGKENGSTLYKVDISKSQVPSLVNAGLSLFAYTTTNEVNASYVTYDDYDRLVLDYYEKTTGETLSKEFRDAYTNGYDEAWAKANQDQIDKVDEVISDGEWQDQYYKVLEDKGHEGIVYVHADGSYDYYADSKAYRNAHPEETAGDMGAYVGEDMILENMVCTFGVDDKGNLTSNQIQVTFTTTDEDGGQHKLVVTGDLTVTNYGATTVSPLDVGNRTKIR